MEPFLWACLGRETPVSALADGERAGVERQNKTLIFPLTSGCRFAAHPAGRVNENAAWPRTVRFPLMEVRDELS